MNVQSTRAASAAVVASSWPKTYRRPKVAVAAGSSKAVTYWRGSPETSTSGLSESETDALGRADTPISADTPKRPNSLP